MQAPLFSAEFRPSLRPISLDPVPGGGTRESAGRGGRAENGGSVNWAFVPSMLRKAGTRKLNREVLAKKGNDYLRDRSRMFHFGPSGMFAPGMTPAASWG